MLAMLVSLPAIAQKGGIPQKYAAGTVPVVDGEVVFTQSVEIPQTRAKSDVYTALLSMAQGLTKEENALPQSRVSVSDENAGLIAVNMEEWMYFKRKAWVTDRTRFYYQLLMQVEGSKLTLTLRNMRYYYDEERQSGGVTYSANKWITDDVAIVKHGTKLSRLSGKFRTHTIDRKDELFAKAVSAAGGKTKKRVKKIIYEEVEE